MRLDKRRRKEGKTNYSKRRKLLEGGHLRLVVRKTNNYVIMQIIECNDAQDNVLYSVNTRELLNKGWPKDKKGSLKSIPAAYLGGLLLGSKAKELKEKVILDQGLAPGTYGSRIYAVVKGIAEGGIEINYNEKISPSDERIKGENTKLSQEEFDKIKENIK